MNKNLFIYSFKYLAVLLALVTFSSCERDEFTEQDAFDLQQAQLDAQTAREEAALAAQDDRVIKMAEFRHSMDSLTRLNSGGKVFYTVNVVPGGSSAFSSGRFEEVEGLDGATVTVSQLGGAVVEQKTTVAGLASFEMYSGEVTVNVEAPNHTDLNYTANLTPDGGVPNGSLIYVGNVVPVFDDPNNPAAGSEENLATVKGFAFAELDITFGNNFEESVPDGTKVRAFINVADPAFKTKYIDQANDESVNTGGQPTASGAIQRFAYEEAASTTGSTVTSALNNDTAPDGGEYSISIGATASGLPITMKFDDFAADRTYVFGSSDFTDTGLDGDVGIGTKRFIYTQNTAVGGNQTQTPIPFVGGVIRTTGSILDFDLVTTEATAIATITGGTSLKTVTGPSVEINGVQYDQYLVTGTDFSSAAASTAGTVSTQSITVPTSEEVYLGDNNRGSYLQTPTVVFPMPTDASGVQATGVAVMGVAGDGEATLDTNTGTVGSGTSDNNLRPVIAVLVTNAGSGYSDNSATSADNIIAKFVRASFTGKDAAGVPITNGTGGIVSTQSGIGFVEVINGGYGYTAAGGNEPGDPTGIDPMAVFNNTGDDEGETPSGGTAPTAAVVVDRQVGTITQIDIPAGGAGAGFTSPMVTIINGNSVEFSDGDINDVDGAAGPAASVLFETDGAGGLRFATGGAGAGLTSVTSGAAGSALGAGNLNLPASGSFALVPNVNVDGTASDYNGSGAINANPTLPQLEATVDASGNVASLRITDPGTGYSPIEDLAVTGITVEIVPVQPRATATAFLSTGGGVSNYFIDNYGVPGTIYSTTLGTSFNYVTATNITQSTTSGITDTGIAIRGGTTTVTVSNTAGDNVDVDGVTYNEGETVTIVGDIAQLDVNAGSVTIVTTGTATGITTGTTTTSAIQSFNNQDGNTVNRADISNDSDYSVVFAGPASGGGQAAAGFPIFEQGGDELVGIVITRQGSGYANTERPNFWIIPNGLTLSEYADGTSSSVNNATAESELTNADLTVTFDTPGLGYALRPEFRLFGGNKSAEDLAAINANITDNLRPRLNFNGAGEITNTSLVYTGAVNLPFTAADLAAEPITVSISIERIEGIFNSEVNGGLDDTPFDGLINVDRVGDNYTGTYTFVNPVATATAPTTALNFFDALETAYATSGEFEGSAGNGKYITAPTFTVISGGADVGTVGVAELNGAADIVGLTTTTIGTAIPQDVEFGNDFSVPAAGEPFRTIGGESDFEVFSGLTYIRDVNYGTGIELE